MDQIDFYFEGVLFHSLKRPFLILQGARFQGRGTAAPVPHSCSHLDPHFPLSRRVPLISSGSPGTRKWSELSVIKIIERFHCGIIFSKIFSTRVVPMSTLCGNRYYRIFRHFGSFPAVRGQSTIAFASHDFQKI